MDLSLSQTAIYPIIFRRLPDPLKSKTCRRCLCPCSSSIRWINDSILCDCPHRLGRGVTGSMKSLQKTTATRLYARSFHIVSKFQRNNTLFDLDKLQNSPAFSAVLERLETDGWTTETVESATLSASSRRPVSMPTTPCIFV